MFQITRLANLVTHQAQRSYVVITFDGGVRPYTKNVHVQEQVRTCVQNKLMTDYAVGPGGSLNSLDVLFETCKYGCRLLQNYKKTDPEL